MWGEMHPGDEFFRHYMFYQEQNPGTGYSGTGGGKMSQLAGCDFGSGRIPGIIIAHEIGHAYDLSHAEMWDNTETHSLTMKDPAASAGQPRTEYQDYWSVMGKGVDYNELDRLRLSWVRETEQRLFLRGYMLFAHMSNLRGSLFRARTPNGARRRKCANA